MDMDEHALCVCYDDRRDVIICSLSLNLFLLCPFRVKDVWAWELYCSTVQKRGDVIMAYSPSLYISVFIYLLSASCRFEVKMGKGEGGTKRHRTTVLINQSKLFRF